MSSQLKLSEQETRVINFLISRNNSNVFWEELAQFAKDPQSVKLKTIKKTISEIKRKYVSAGLSVPFNITFRSMAPEKEETKPVEVEPLNFFINAIDGDELLPTPTEPPKPQVLVQLKKIPTTTIATGNTPTSPTHPAHKDFVLERNYKSVRTKYGSHRLNDNEWELFKYIYPNVGRIIPISELRDKVVYPLAGSKLPARWFDAIMRTINNLRRQVPNLDKRLLTVKSTETSYLFQ